MVAAERYRQRSRAARLSARPPHPAPAKLTSFAKPTQPSPARGEGGTDEVMTMENVASGSMPVDDVPAFVGQLAHQPIWLQRVGEPRLGPAVGDAAAHDAFV